MKAIFKSATSILFMSIMAMLVSVTFSLNAYAVFGVLLLASLIRMPKGYALMALQREVWEGDIVENLYKDNEFALRAFNADQFVLAGKVVHIPVAGSSSTVKKNLSSFPQSAVNRTDSELTYSLDTFYSLPRQIQDIEKYELSYDKRMSVAGEDVKGLVEAAMSNLIYKWAPTASGNIIEATGAGTTDDLIDSTATGTRSTFSKADFKKIAKLFSNNNINDRKSALLTAYHYHQFFESLSDAEKTNFNNVANLKEGAIGRYMGIDVLMRSSVLRYRKTAGVWGPVDEQDDAFAAAAGDSAASLFWSDSSVERAKGDVIAFEDNGNPLYYGDVFSALLRLGGRKRRTSGVYAVVEAVS